jgi:hypothetical protein
MGNERWLPVVGHEGRYEISDMGRARSLDRILPRKYKDGRIIMTFFHGKILSPMSIAKVYVGYRFRDGTPSTMASVAVLEAFVGPRPLNHKACHNNGKSKDNRLENLRWDTQSSNIKDAVAQGTVLVGEKRHNSKLTDAAVREFKKQRASMSIADAARKCGIPYANAWSIDKRRSWGHIV